MSQSSSFDAAAAMLCYRLWQQRLNEQLARRQAVAESARRFYSLRNWCVYD